MKKWLVGLMAAGLCAASAWANTVDVLTNEDVGSQSTNYKDWTATGGSGAVYAGTSAGGGSANPCIQLRTSSPSGIVTTESGGNATKVTLVWNAATTNSSRAVDVYGKTEPYGSPSDLFDKSLQGTSLGSIQLGATELAIEGEYPFIGLRSTSGALFLDKVEIEWAGGTPPAFSIKLDPADDFNVVQDKSASITATVKGAQGDVSYSWSVDGSPINLAGNVYEIDSSVVGGPYEVTCEASDGVSDPVVASVSYTVVEAPVVTGDVLTQEITGVEGSNYKDWTTTGVSGAVYVGNSAGGNDSIQLRSEKNTAGIVIMESGGSDVASVTVEWNENTAEGRAIQIYGSTDAYASPADLYGDAKGTLLGEIAKGQTTLDVPEGYPYVGIRSKSGALYLTSVAIEFAGGPAALSLSFDQDNPLKLEEGTPGSVTAVVKGGEAPYTYVWESETAELNGTDATLAIPATLAVGTYTATATVTDNAGIEVTKPFGIVISEPAQKFTVSVADGIQNGTIELSVDDGEVVPDPIEVAAGATVKVVAMPESGFKLASLEVETEGGQPVELSKSNTFEMPAENVWISASFEESTGGTVTYTVKSKTEVEATGDIPEGSSATYAADSTQVAQISSNKTAVLTLKGYEGMTITGLTLSMKSNKSAGAGSLSVTCGAAVLASIEDSSFATGWSTAFSTEYVDVVPEVTATAIDGDVVITIAGSVNSLYCQSYTVEYETGGSAPLRVSLDQENPLRLDVGTGASVTATATGGEKPYTFAWECSTAPELNGTGETLAIPDTLGLGTYNVWLTVSDSSDPAREIMQAFVVVVQEPAVPHDVKIAVGIQGGVVTADPEKASVGETVTLTATPADGKKLESMTVTYGETTLTFTSSPAEFEMPDEDVYVGATFVDKPVVSGDVLTRESTGVTGSQYKDWTFTGESGTVYAGQSAGGNESIQLRTTSPAGIVITESAGSDVASVTVEWNDATADKRSIEIYGSADAYTGPADLYGDAKGTLLGTIALGETTLEIPEGYPYVGILAKGGALYLSSVAFEFGGAAAFSVSLDPSEDFEVKQGQDAAITATVRGAQGEVTYSWSVDGNPINLAGNVYAIDSSVIGGPYEVVCEASDGVSEPVTASVSYTVVEVPPVTGDEFALVESVDGLQDGTRVVLTDPDGTLALSTTVANSVFTTTEVQPVDDVITTDDANIIWKLVDDGEGNFSLYNEEAGKYAGHAGGGTSNSGRLQDDPFPNAISVADGLFVIAATTADSAGNYRDLQYNYNSGNPRFAYYKGTQKNLRIYAAASGPAKPSISVSGEPTKKVGETFELQFTLKNYEGEFTWVNDGREGGSIDEATGLYTWTPSEDGEVTITVKAMDGDTEIASKEVALTVLPGDEPPPEATLTCEPASVTMAAGESFEVTLTLDGAELDGGFIYFEGYEGVFVEESPATIDLADLELAEGTYTLVALAVDEGMNELARAELPVTVTGEGPGPQPVQPVITGISVDAAAGEVTVTFTGDGMALQGTDDLVAGTWEDVSAASFGDGTVTVPMEKPYLRIRP